MVQISPDNAGCPLAEVVVLTSVNWRALRSLLKGELGETSETRWRPMQPLQYVRPLVPLRALQLRREARMVSPAMGAAMIGTMYFLRANCAQHGGSASGGGLISAPLY